MPARNPFHGPKSSTIRGDIYLANPFVTINTYLIDLVVIPSNDNRFLVIAVQAFPTYLNGESRWRNKDECSTIRPFNESFRYSQPLI
jgi:hypothetical protein